MNCRECLDELATGSLRDLQPDSAVSRHAATCPDCGPLLTQLRDREYQAATILNNLPPIANPVAVAENAGLLAHRRRFGSIAVTLTAVALGITIWFTAYTLIPGATWLGFTPTLHTETIPLSCLSPEQAGDIIEPYVRSNGRMYYVTPGVPAITVRAKYSEIAGMRDVLAKFDNDHSTACQANTAAGFDGLQQGLKALEGLKGLDNLKELDKLKDLEKLKDLDGSRPVLAGEKPAPQKSKPSPR